MQGQIKQEHDSDRMLLVQPIESDGLEWIAWCI